MARLTEKPMTNHRLIRMKEVLEILPISKSTWWEGVRTGQFPKPRKLGDRISCWRLEDILRLVGDVER